MEEGKTKKERKPKKCHQKSYVEICDEIRIRVKETGELTVQLKTDGEINEVETDNEDDEIEAGWANDGYFYKWTPCLLYIHSVLVVKHILRKPKISLLELKEVFEETHKMIKTWFTVNLK